MLVRYKENAHYTYSGTENIICNFQLHGNFVNHQDCTTGDQITMMLHDQGNSYIPTWIVRTMPHFQIHI